LTADVCLQRFGDALERGRAGGALCDSGSSDKTYRRGFAFEDLQKHELLRFARERRSATAVRHGPKPKVGKALRGPALGTPNLIYFKSKR